MEIIGLFLLFVFVLWGISKMPGHRAPAVSAGKNKPANVGAYPHYLDDVDDCAFDYFDPAVRNLMGDD